MVPKAVRGQAGKGSQVTGNKDFAGDLGRGGVRMRIRFWFIWG